MKTTRLTLLAIAIAALSTLVACGGGSSSSKPPATGFSNVSLKGSFTFLAIGADQYATNSFGGPGDYEVGGVLVADGNGNITGGEQTYDDVPNVVPDTFTGTYTIGSNGLGTITLNTGDTNIGMNNSGTEIFTVVMLSSSKALITQFDTSATSTGILEAQTSTALPTGGYAFSVFGADVANNVGMSIGGVFNIDNNPSTGIISGAGSVGDINDGGTLSLAQSVNGAAASPDMTTTSPDSFGKFSLALTIGSNSVLFDGYIVDSNHVQLVEDDSFGVTGGTAYSQGSSTGTFTTNSAFSGSFVYGLTNYNILGPGAIAGTITADGSGNLINGLVDLNFDGSDISDTLTGSYAVDNTGTGRVVVGSTAFGVNGTGPMYIFYLTGTGQPVPMQEIDTVAYGSGTAYAQSSTAPSFNGTYGLDFHNIDTSFVENDGVAQITATASAGTFSGTANVNSDLVPSTNQTFTGTFSTFTGGRAIGTVMVNTNAPVATAVYLTDSTQGFVIEIDAGGVTLGSIRQQVAP